MWRRLSIAAAVIITLPLLLNLAGCGKAATPHGSQPNANTPRFAISFSASADSNGQPADGAASVGQHAAGTADGARSFGSILGVVKWTGPLPKLDPVLVNKDTHVCAEHGKHDRPPEQLIVHEANRGIKDAVLQLFGTFDDARPLGELKYPETLNQRLCSYEPRIFVVPVGARITMTSDDDVGHNVRMSGAVELNIAVSKGQSSSRRFDQAGLVKLGCDIHPWMSGYMHIVKHPYYAVTDKEGRFELLGVPAGEHQLRFWHEAWWTEDGKVAPPIVSTHIVMVRPRESTIVDFELSDPTLAPRQRESQRHRDAKDYQKHRGDHDKHEH